MIVAVVLGCLVGLGGCGENPGGSGGTGGMAGSGAGGTGTGGSAGAGGVGGSAGTPGTSDCSVVPIAPPASLELDRFYTKYVDAGGIPLVSSEKVSDAAFEPACLTIVHMLQRLPEVPRDLAEVDVRVGIMAVSEVTTDMPEHSDLYDAFPGTDWDTRARGLGATIARPLTSVGEENLLKLPSDVYLGESILVHEFGHTVFDLGVARADGGAAHVKTLIQLYSEAASEGRWANTYAMTNRYEYWAEAVQSWFGVNLEADPPDGIHNFVDTRAELEAYNPNMAAFISQFYVAEDAPH